MFDQLTIEHNSFGIDAVKNDAIPNEQMEQYNEASLHKPRITKNSFRRQRVN
jgi:hypothetical protein